ncbi:MAG: hypothetical protein HFE78_05110 [Clostridiales bacterium]|nr:hypothetical protein [Clostridiales bacterium]
MKKLFILLLGILWLTSCTYNAGKMPQESDPPLESSSESTNANTEEPFLLREYLHTDFPQLGLKNQRIYHMAWGYFMENTGSCAVTVFSEEQPDNEIFNKVFMVVDLNGEFLTFEMGEFNFHVIQNGNLYTADINGDGFDEIIYSGEVSGNGGTISRIYQIKDKQIELMYDLNEWEDIKTSKYGYTYEFLEGCRLEIKNELVGYSVIQDISEYMSPAFFDEKGMPTIKETIFFRAFDSRTIVEEDKYGKGKLKYMQYIDGETIYGYTITTLQYNNELKKFDVVDAEYIAEERYFGWERLLDS